MHQNNDGINLSKTIQLSTKVQLLNLFKLCSLSSGMYRLNNSRCDD